MANSPKRIQRSRTAGWRMPENAKSVARPSRWGNPFKVEDNHQGAVDQFTKWVEQQGDLMQAIRSELRGHDLACYCKPEQPCHADVLLRIANT